MVTESRLLTTFQASVNTQTQSSSNEGKAGTLNQGPCYKHHTAPTMNLSPGHLQKDFKPLTRIMCPRKREMHKHSGTMGTLS